MIWAYGLLLPSAAVTVRRLHDIDRAGWWIWIGLVTGIGGLVLLAFALARHAGREPVWRGAFLNLGTSSRVGRAPWGTFGRPPQFRLGGEMSRATP